MENTLKLRPFLKWAGNKYKLANTIIPVLPKGKRLIEPFAGSAAIFLNSNYEHYVLADVNADLINLYKIIKREGKQFIKYAQQFFSTKTNQAQRYYQLREQFNECNDPLERSALFLYLNRHCYNGLCRYNNKGYFNVPFGRYRNPYFPSEEIIAFQHKAKRATFRCEDFLTVMHDSQQGDVIYCDPPYVPLSLTANFTRYAHQHFDLEQQQQLAAKAKQVASKKVPVIISNHDTEYTRKLYRGAKLEKFFVNRFISCKVKDRQPVGELLAIYK